LMLTIINYIFAVKPANQNTFRIIMLEYSAE
jgi:hypothetical protein